MLESEFERLCTSLSLFRPAGKFPPYVNYTPLRLGIMNLNYNEHKIMNAIRHYKHKSINGRTDVYETNVISASMAALTFSTGGVFLR